MLLCCNLFRPSFLPSVPVLIFPVTLFNKSNLATINNCLEWVGGWAGEGGLVSHVSSTVGRISRRKESGSFNSPTPLHFLHLKGHKQINVH